MTAGGYVAVYRSDCLTAAFYVPFECGENACSLRGSPSLANLIEDSYRAVGRGHNMLLPVCMHAIKRFRASLVLGVD